MKYTVNNVPLECLGCAATRLSEEKSTTDTTSLECQYCGSTYVILKDKSKTSFNIYNYGTIGEQINIGTLDVNGDIYM